MTTMIHEQNNYVLTVTCASSRGIIAGVSTFLAERGCNVLEMAEFNDVLSGRFFMRTVFRTETDPKPNLQQLTAGFEATAAQFGMEWAIHDSSARPRVLIMVSKFDHCLNDLLYRRRTGELHMDIPAIVSNHPNLKPLADWHDIPYHHLPVTAETKGQQEKKLMELVGQTQADLVVLARYMQVLSNELCERLRGRAINIHHSFLPGFKGAKPYHQAYQRGVKLIGATAHYVTADLDEGPIIEQVVERVDHTHRPEHLVATGRDSECLALARAVKYHTEQRVFLNGNKTVVFR